MRGLGKLGNLQPPDRTSTEPSAKKKGPSGPNPVQFVTLGGEMAGTAFLGYLIDLNFQTIPAWTVVGAIFGVIASGLHLVRIIGDMNKNDRPRGTNPQGVNSKSEKTKGGK